MLKQIFKIFKVVGVLKIKIEDVNDNPPEFVNAPYEAEIEEGQVDTAIRVNKALNILK